MILRHTLAIFGIGLLAVAASAARAAEPNAQDLEFFEAKIRPVLVEACYKCHSAGPKAPKGGLLLDSKDGLLKGGDTGPALVPGKPDDSLLIKALRYGDVQMPPKEKLPDAVIADFVKWVERGAADPRTEKVVRPGIDFAQAREFWSFRPVRAPALPAVKQSAWAHNGIDRFVLAQLEANQLQPVRPADKRTLLRRATFDLTGLPPTPAEVEAFLADDSTEAFAKVVDRLLASPAYGERWARYWLDVARFAEDQAHTFAVEPNVNGWRYRDWVIDAFNADLPYDRFVKLQIAADQIDAPEAEKQRNLPALGFFGLGAQYYKNTDAAKAIADELDDRVDTLSRGFLGLTVSCARCHDHKFDPIPTQDYYSLAGVFHSSKLAKVALAPADVVARYDQAQGEIRKEEERYKKLVHDEKAHVAEGMTGEVASYLTAAYSLRVRKLDKPNASPGEIAKERKLNGEALNRWIKFLESNNHMGVASLDAWRKLPAPAKGAEETPAEAVAAATAFQEEIQASLAARDGLTVEVRKDAAKGMPRFVSKLVTKVKQPVDVVVELNGSRELYLAVNDGGDGNSCDWADWGEPRLIGPNGEKKLTELKWKSSDGGVRVDQNQAGQAMRMVGKDVAYGFGTHAPSMLVFELPEGYTKFVARAGLDNGGTDQGECGGKASVQFKVYTEQPADKPMAFQADGLGKPQAELLKAIFTGDQALFPVPDDMLKTRLPAERMKAVEAMRNAVDALKKTAPPQYPVAHGLADNKAEDLKVYVRGNPAKQGDLAPRRFLRIVAGDNPAPFTKGSGRLELAEAIASRDNPLTPRVMVNRIWQHHFGKGIVGTPSNFGALGEKPTHPELLDYLAARFIESSWSIKAVHREILLSATYQLSNEVTKENAAIDVDNRFLWRQNRHRLDIEAYRDALLAVSGQLDPKTGGPSVDLRPTENRRRTVYAKISRHELDGVLRLFDFPDANITSEKRTETTVPQQQLFVLNSPFMADRARGLAARLQAEAGDDQARIRRAFLLAFGRPATDAEVALGLRFVQTVDPAEDNGRNQLDRWQRYAQVLLASNEFITVD